MAQSKDRFRLDATRSLLFPIFLFITLLGIGSTYALNLENGRIYFIIILTSIVGVYVGFFFFRRDTTIFEFPFEKTLLQGVFGLYVGFLLPTIINLISSVKTYQVIKPFAIFSTAGGVTGQSFKIITLQLDKFWSYFYTVWVAGIGETFVFNFATIVIGIIIGHFILEFNPNIAKTEKGKRMFRAGVGLLFSGLVFVISHGLNGSYNDLNMFLLAFLFLLLMNFILYFLNFFIMFVVGFHMSNNFWANLQENLAGALTTKGLILDAFLLILLMYLVLNFKKVPEMFKGHEYGW